MKKTMIVLVAISLLVTGSFAHAQNDDQAPIPPLDNSIPQAVADTQQSVSDLAAETYTAPVQPLVDNATNLVPTTINATQQSVVAEANSIVSPTAVAPATAMGCSPCATATTTYVTNACGSCNDGCQTRGRRRGIFRRR